MKVVGIVKNIHGKYFAKDKEGNIRELKVGDKVYEGEVLYGDSVSANILIQNPYNDSQMTLSGKDGFEMAFFGDMPKEEKSSQDEDIDNAQTLSTTTTTKSSEITHTIDTLQNATGEHSTFLERTGKVVNVEATLIDANLYSDTYDFNKIYGDTIPVYNPAPELTTNLSQVEDNFYDSYQPSGTDTANNSFTFEALSGLKNITIGTHVFTLAELQALNTTPEVITMQAGDLTLNKFFKSGSTYTVSYTYQTSDNYLHEKNSDVFADTLQIVVIDNGGQTATSSLVINVIDDLPTSQDDVNSIVEGNYLKNEVTGNVMDNDHVGADDDLVANDVVGVSGGTIGTELTTTYGFITLQNDGSYVYRVDNDNLSVKALIDGETLHDSVTYTLQDLDFDTTESTLDITIEGQTSSPAFYVTSGNAYESSIDVIGTDETNTENIVTGFISAITGDGFKEVLFESAGHTLLLNLDDLNAIATGATRTMQTEYGTIVFDGYSDLNHPVVPGLHIGKLTYTYTLDSAVNHTLDTDDTTHITITDIRGNSASDDLQINIIDDVPIAADNVNMVTEDSSESVTASGNVFSDDDGSGVDNQGADQGTTKVLAQSVKGTYGTVVFNADGTYTYKLDNDNPVVDALNTGETLTDTMAYTLVDEDGSTDTADLIITINGFSDPNLSVADVTVVEDGTVIDGVPSGDMKVIFTITMDTASPRDVTFDYTTVDGTGVDGKEYTALAGTAKIDAGTQVTTVTVILGPDDYVADSGKTFDLKISNVNSAGAIVDAVGTATITDDSAVDTPYISGDGTPHEGSQEGVTLKLISVDSAGNPLLPSSIAEGESAYYKILVLEADGTTLAKDKNGALASGTVNVEFNKLVSDTATGGVDYVNTLSNVAVNSVFSVDSIDDFISDDGETFTLSIVDDTSYSNASDFENVTHDTTAVTTTIVDNVDVTTLDLSGDAIVAEDAVSGAASYTLTLSQNVQTDLTVQITLTHVDTEDADFSSYTVTRDVTVPAGHNSVTFPIDIFDDAVYEGDEDYKVSITDVNGGDMESIVVGTSEVTTTIVDDETPPELSIDPITILEDGTATFTVTLSGEAKEDVTFDFATSERTATAGKDYVAQTGSGAITAGGLTTTITVVLSDDYLADNGETFDVTLSNASVNAVISATKGSATATIEDNAKPDTPFDDTDTIENGLESVELKLLAFDEQGNVVASNTVEEGSPAYYKVVMFEVGTTTPVLDANGNPPSGTVTVAYTDGSATGANSSSTTDGSEDYNNSLVNITVNQIFSVETFNDATSEGDETFEINIVDKTYSSPEANQFENVITDTSKITTTITESSIPTYTFVDIVNDASVDEADGALLTHALEFKALDGTPVTLAAGEQVTVDLTYSNDATDTADFQTKTTQVVITGDGSSSYSFSNVVADDFLKEGSESYTLKIASVNDDNSYFEGLLPFGFGSVTGTINDEATPDEVLVSIVADQIITEGDISGNFTVAVDRPAAEVTSDIKVALTYSGIAIDGTDYTGVTEVTIPAGSNSTTFTISTIQDKDIEGSEDFTITIGTITDTNFEAIAPNPSAPSVTNTIIDDVNANPDTNALKEGGNQVTGYLLANDEVGVNGKVTAFTYMNESGTTQSGVIGVEANTQYGRMTVEANGKYTYYSDTTPENHPSDGNTDTAILSDVINYTVTDDNGDSDSSMLTVNVGDTIGTVIDGPTSSINEDDLPSGSDTTKESLITTNNDLGIQASTDGVDNVRFNLTEVQAALDLKSHGVALSYTLSGADNNILTAKAGTTEVFVVTINKNAGADASYNFELKAPIDHLNSSGGKLDSLDIKIPFQYKEIGSTEDIVQGNLTVNVIDDTPTAVVDAEVTVVEGTATPIRGNVLTNDIQGADGALLHDFKYKDTSGTLQDKYFSDTVTTYTVDTPTGSLTVNQDGSWSFTAYTYVDHDDAIQGTTHIGDGSDNDSIEGSFDYRLQDYDTDNSNYVTQVIHVTDGTDPSSSGVINAVDEDDIVGSGSDQTQSATVIGTLSVTSGSDPIDVNFTTTGSGTFTSNGVAITYALSNAGHTLTGSAGSEIIFIAQVTGDATVNNPTYSFELKGQIDHADASGENTIDLPIEYKALDIDGDSVTNNLVVTVTDDVPNIGTPVDGAVDESGLPYGATPDKVLTITTGTLAVGQEADTIDTVFDAATITALEAQNIQATLGNELTYALSNSGHTLTASFGGTDYFRVDIKNPTDATASYEFTLINAIHESSSGGTQNINIPFSVSDFDKDTTNSSFNIVVTDDTGATDKQLTLDEDGTITFGVTADTITDTGFPVSTSHGVISFDSGTNLFTYTPTTDYSGVDNGIVLDYVVNGVSHSVNVDTTINPVSDKPTLSEDASNISTDEDVAVPLGFNRPIVKDNTDQNNSDTVPNSTDGDNPERLGEISLLGLTNGTKLLDAGGSVLWTSDGSAVKIVLSDLDENSDGQNDHLYGVSGDLTLTVDEFEALQVLPPLNSGTNLSVTMEVTSYEVNAAGEKLASVAGAKSSQTVSIDVHAKTDDGVAITVADISGNEDNWICIDDAITITKTLDVDGSEVYELVFDASNLPAGTLYYSGTTPVDMSDRSIGTDASSGFSVTITDVDNLPEIYIMTPVNDSTDIKDLKVTVNIHDTDADSTPDTDTVKSASDFVDVLVAPVANDITVTTTGSEGDEDTKIPLNLSFTNEDGALSTPVGLEKVTSVTIADIPSDVKLFDENGQEVSISGGSVTVSIIGGDTSKIEQYTIQPPAHSSKDITLQVSMTIKDEDDNDGALHIDTTTTIPVDIVVKVDPVSEMDTSDTAAPSGNDITPVTAHTYSTYAEEDTYFDLNTADAGYVLDAANEDALVNADGTTNPYGSEETFVVFSNAQYFDGPNAISVGGATFVKYNDGTSDKELQISGAGEVRVPLEFLDTVQIRAARDFAGTFKVDTYVQNQDLGEDASETAGSLENSAVSTLVINVNPVPEVNPSVSINNLSGLEDAGRNADGTIDAISAANGIALSGILKSSDIDGSETFTIIFDKMPEDAALFYKGNIIYANSGTDFVSDGITVANNTDGTFKITVTSIDLATPPLFIPPHNSNEDVTLQVSGQIIDTATLEDGTVITVPGAVSTPIPITVVLKGVADNVVNTELKTFDVSVDTQQPNGDKFIVTELSDGSGAYNAIVEEDSDTSGKGVLLDLKDIYKDSTLLNSYDNVASNAVDVAPVSDTSVATETVNLTVTGLDAQFDLQGAVLVNGTGTSRIFTFTLTDLQSGNIKVVVPEHYSGEVALKVQYVTTENDGDSKTSVFDDVKILVTPKAEDISPLQLNTLDVNEDQLKHIDFTDYTNPLPDNNGNDETLYEVWIKKNDVENKDFTLFTDTSYTKLADAVDGNDISIETIGGNDYYYLQNATFNDLYVQYDADIGGRESIFDAANPLDTNFEIKYTFMDNIDADGKTLENISPQETTTYSMDLSPVTDDIDAKATSITDDDGDADTDIQDESIDTNGDVTLKVLDNTVLKVVVNLDGVDTADEVDITNPSDTTNNPDYDGSEKIVSLKIDGVPKGVSIKGGYYAGDQDSNGDGITEYSGIWYIDNPQDANGGDLLIDGTSTYNLVLNIDGTIKYNDPNYSEQEVGGTITVSFENQDANGASIQTDIVTIDIDDTSYNPTETPEIPMEIIKWDTTENENVIVEDTPTSLFDIVNFKVIEENGTNTNTNFDVAPADGNSDVITSNKFSITIEGLENCTVSGWKQDTHNTNFWTFDGQGGNADIETALKSLLITPNQDYNQNHDTAQGDTQSKWDEGPLTFTTTLTTYADNGYSDTQSLNYSGNVQPITDDITVDSTFDFVDEDGVTHSPTVANEDGTFNIDMSIDSVDNPYLTVVSTDVRITNVSPDNIGVIVADSSNETLDGQISWDGGATWVALNAGDFVDVPYSDINNVVFKLNQDIAGHVKLTYSVDVLEKDDTTTPTAKTVTGDVEFDVHPIADGLASTGDVKIVGDEDTFIELTDSSGNSFNTLSSDDPTEEVTSLMLSGVPVGYLVYVGADGSQVLANNLGVDGSGNNSWAIDASGSIPQIWLKAPEDVGGVTSTPTAGWNLLDSIQLVTGVDDMGSIIFSTQDVQLQINAVADDLESVSAEDINDVEGEDIDFIFNALVKDTDGSEQLKITLQGLGAYAVFKLAGVELDASVVSYDARADTYAIDSSEVNYNTVKQLSVNQNDFSGTVTVGLSTVEKSNGNESAVTTDTFTMTIIQQPNSASDDVLLFDFKGTDGGSGDDTLIFGTDWNSIGIDFTALDDTLTKNIETLDLTQHGDHSITLNTTDVEAMTDSRNALTIESDAGDTINIQNNGDNVWAQQGTTNVYEDVNGTTLTINGLGTIDKSGMNATAGDDVLGYNDTNTIDGGIGNDRLIIFDTKEVDFTKVQNAEILDYEVVGDHTVTNLTLDQVIAITDGNNDLKIFGDVSDNIDFDASDNWVKNDTGNAYGGAIQTEGGKTFDVYTSANDTSVEVKVQVEVHDSI